MQSFSIAFWFQVSIYGFAGSYSAFSEHYYDKTYSKHVNYANHDNNAENKLWEYLDEQGIVKLFRRTPEKGKWREKNSVGWLELRR